MSVRRVSALGASFVWIDESTRCPVSAARTAISAVSGSRISPIITTSGSERRIWRRPEANVSPIALLTPICVTPSIWYSTGSSTVMILRVSSLMRLSAAYRVVDLPEPVGPRDEDRAVRLAQELLHCGEVLRVHAQVLEGVEREFLREHADDDRLAVWRRQRGDAQVDRPVVDAQLDAAVLRTAPLGDVHVRHDLDAAGHLGPRRLREPHDLVQHAVDPVAHPMSCSNGSKWMSEARS